MAYNKLIYGGTIKFDLSGDTITPSDVAAGVTFHDSEGEAQEGTSTLDADTSNDDAQVGEILSGKKAHARGELLEGTMPNRGTVTATIDDKDDVYTIPTGYHDGDRLIYRRRGDSSG